MQGQSEKCIPEAVGPSERQRCPAAFAEAVVGARKDGVAGVAGSAGRGDEARGRQRGHPGELGALRGRAPLVLASAERLLRSARNGCCEADRRQKGVLALTARRGGRQEGLGSRAGGWLRSRAVAGLEEVPSELPLARSGSTRRDRPLSCRDA
jgi:hypothetical protein